MVLELEDVPLKEREPLQWRGSKFPIPISPYPSGTLQGLLTPYTPIGRNFEETGDMGIGNLLQFLFHHSFSIPSSLMSIQFVSASTLVVLHIEGIEKEYHLR